MTEAEWFKFIVDNKISIEWHKSIIWTDENGEKYLSPVSVTITPIGCHIAGMRSLEDALLRAKNILEGIS